LDPRTIATMAIADEYIVIETGPVGQLYQEAIVSHFK
jgi:hypothetical protein